MILYTVAICPATFFKQYSLRTPMGKICEVAGVDIQGVCL